MPMGTTTFCTPGSGGGTGSSTRSVAAIRSSTWTSLNVPFVLSPRRVQVELQASLTGGLIRAWLAVLLLTLTLAAGAVRWNPGELAEAADLGADQSRGGDGGAWSCASRNRMRR